MNCRLTVFPEAHFQISIHFLTRFQSRVSVVYITLTGNSKLLPLLSPPRRSDLACLATEERHSPNPVFDPPRGETHRHRGAETRLCSPRQGVSESRFNVPPSQHKFQLKAKKIPSRLSHRRRPSFSSFTPGSQSLLPPAIKQQRWAR